MAFELTDGAREVAEAPSTSKGRAVEVAVFLILIALILIAPSMSCPYSALFYWRPARAL